MNINREWKQQPPPGLGRDGLFWGKLLGSQSCNKQQALNREAPSLMLKQSCVQNVGKILQMKITFINRQIMQSQKSSEVYDMELHGNVKNTHTNDTCYATMVFIIKHLLKANNKIVNSSYLG